MKNKTKPIFLLIKHTVFPFDVLVSVSTDEELKKYVDKNLGYKLSEKEMDCLEIEGDARTVMLHGGQVIIRLKRENRLSWGVDLSDLAHEIEHAAFFILNRIGVKHTNESDEVFAYYQAYLLRECLKNFEK